MNEEGCCGDGASPRMVGNRFYVEAVATMDERGQMVIPKAIRERAGLKAGDKMAISVMERGGKVFCITLIKTEELAVMVKEILGPAVNEVL